jgi:hypothetical protein
VNGRNGIPLDAGLSSAGFLQPRKTGSGAADAPVAGATRSAPRLAQPRVRHHYITVIDDVLTSGPDLGAQPLGRAQGLYVMAFTAASTETRSTSFGVYKMGTPLCRLSHHRRHQSKFKGACRFAEVRPFIASGQHASPTALRRF